MATSFGALCNDFYVNAKLALKMDLPDERETLLSLMDRVRRAFPKMEQFHRYEGELVLESNRREAEYRWISLQRNSMQTGHVNPDSLADADKFHRLVMELAPYHLSISPLDVDHLEVLFGFDLECKPNQDEVVFEALFAQTPMADLLRVKGGKVVDVQPMFGLSLSEAGDEHAYFEIKTRTRNRRGGSGRSSREPLSIFLTLRRFGPIRKLEDVLKHYDHLRQQAEALAGDKVVPELLTPISRQITSSNA